MMKRIGLTLALMLASQMRAAAAEPEQRTFALVVGFNGRPPTAGDGSIRTLV